ncbi:MAG: cupin domain-containing protein [Pseudomonadota bacterium]
MHGLDIARFLADAWQQTPLLIPHATTSLPALSPDELAGLALEEGVSARLVVGTDPDWQVDKGPFHDNSFFIEGPWTLLVEAVDHHIPEVATLRQLVSFLPSWRFDDVMVSYATDGGGVGPHFDRYDVFLLQGEGQRRWRLGQSCDQSEPLRHINGLTLLEKFEQTAEYVLGPGDILYIPPGVAHWGIAEGHCMTYSLGFRAPRIADLLSRQLDERLESVDLDLLLADPGRPATRPGELHAIDISNALQQMTQTLEYSDSPNHWLGELVTESALEPIYPSAKDLLPATVRIDPASRWAWQQAPDTVTLFTNGTTRSVASELLPLLIRLCSGNSVDCETCSDLERTFLEQQWQAGTLIDE